MNFFENFATNGSTIVLIVVFLLVVAADAGRLASNDRRTAKAAAHRLQVEGQLASLKEFWTL